MNNKAKDSKDWEAQVKEIERKLHEIEVDYLEDDPDAIWTLRLAVISKALTLAASDARRDTIEECALASESIVPRHTECGNKIAASIRALAKAPASGEEK